MYEKEIMTRFLNGAVKNQYKWPWRQLISQLTNTISLRFPIDTQEYKKYQRNMCLPIPHGSSES